MKTKSRKALPKKRDNSGSRKRPAVVTPLPGVVCPQFVRCGRPGCRCASKSREDLHGPYHYRFWRENGRLQKTYVKSQDLADVRRACAAYTFQQKQRKRNLDEVTSAFTEFKRLRDDVRASESRNRRDLIMQRFLEESDD